MRHVDHHRHDLESRLVKAEQPLDLGDDVVRRGQERGGGQAHLATTEAQTGAVEAMSRNRGNSAGFTPCLP
jgi:hypothetical protein